MKRVREVGAAAAVAVVVVLVSSQCSAGDDGESTGASEPTPTVSSAEPYVPPEPVEPPVPVYSVGPEGDIDKLADEKGWVVDSLYGSPSAYVRDICDSLPVSAVDSSPRPEWLAGQFEGDNQPLLQAGIPKLCPKWSKTLKQAVSGDYERWYSDGEYEVTSKAPEPVADGEDPVLTIPPGTYRTRGQLDDCYWERATRAGEIIDNNFASAARDITVTIRASDGMFKADGCGTWKPVK